MVWPTDFDVHLDEFDKMDLPGQQLTASHANTLLDHNLNLNYQSNEGCQRLTGIMATVGKGTSDIGTLEKMISAGMNIALINMCFGRREDHIELIKMLKQAAKNVGTKMGKICPLGIAIQLAGKKIRTGRIAENYGDTVELKTGEIFRVTTDETYKDRCSMYTVYVDFMNFADQVKKGDHIIIDNEAIMMKVEIISASTLTCRIERGGLLGSYKDVFVPNVVFNMPDYSDRDKLDIQMALHHQVDIIIATFVNTPGAVTELRHLLGEKGKKISIVANIQTIKGYHNYDSILSVTDGVMVTRQELGSDINPKKMVIAQKNLIVRANVASVPVFISAHFLTTMRYECTPLRSEVLDISNCILDGCDGLVISAATAVGHYPVETVATMSGICKEAEACIWTKQVFLDLLDKTVIPCNQTTGIALAAVLAAQRVIASAIVVITTTGNSAQVISKYRPRCPILAVTRYAPIAKRLHLWRGILPIIYENVPDADWQVDVDKRIFFGTKWAMERGFIRVGDPVVAISGWRQATGIVNNMRIIYASVDLV